MKAINNSVAGATGQGDISGAGGKSSSEPRRFIAPDTIRSRAQLKLLYAISAGPVDGLAEGAASLKLDGVPVGNAASSDVNIGGVTWSFSNGDANAERHDGFNAIETAEPVGHTLLKDIPHSRVSPHQHTAKGDLARLTFQFPRGLVQASDEGVFGAEVALKFETRKPDGSWVERATRTIAEKKQSSFEVQINISIDETYTNLKPAVRVTRINTVSTDQQTADQVIWKAVSWVKADQLSYQGVSTLAVEYDAEVFGQRLPELGLEINGRSLRVPQNYNPVTRTYSGVWSGAFKLAFSNNPAWVLYDLLTDRQWGLGLAPRLIEVFDLYEIATYNDEDVDDGKGGVEPRFLFDAILARRTTAMDLIRQVCGSMHVLMFWSSGRLRFVQDKPQTPLMWITNDHVIDGKFVYAGVGQRDQYSHALVSFLDPDRGGAIAVEAEMRRDVLARQGYAAKEVALLGCRRRSQARRHARWLLEKSDDTIFAVSWRAGLDYFADNPVRPGDVIKITDRMHGGFSAVGRMKVASITGSADHIQISQHHAEGAALAYYEDSDGGVQQHVQVRIQTNDWAQKRLITITPQASDWPAPPADGKAIVLKSQQAGPSGFNFRITSVREVDDFQVEIEAVRHDDESFTRIENNLDIPVKAAGNVPDFSGSLPLATGLVLTQPAQVDAQERLRDVVVSWTAPAHDRVAAWQIDATGPYGEVLNTTTVTPPVTLRDLVVGEWSVVVRAIDWLGRRGNPKTAAITVRKDPVTAKPPASPSITAGYGQLTLSWDMTGQPYDASVEVLSLTSASSTRPQLIHTVRGTTVSIASPAGVVRYFKLRTRLKGGTTSPLTSVLTATALTAPKGEDGADGADGIDGRDGIDGTNGADGADGRRGSVIADGTVTTPAWSDAAAITALAGINAGAAVAGDIVTLRSTSSSSSAQASSAWAETRRYDGASWQVITPILSGTAIAEATLPASRLKVDPAVLKAKAADDDTLTLNAVPADLITTGVLQSSNYQKDESGFSIDTAGTAELNNARIRGVLDSGEIKGSVIIASSRVLPTQDQTTFFTLENERPVTFERRQIVSGQGLTLGPMMINPSVGTRRFSDGRKTVLSCNNPKGTAAGGANSEYTRFWSKTPMINASFEFSASGEPWGEDIVHGKIKVVVKTSGGRVLATSPLYRLNQIKGFGSTVYTDTTWRNRKRDRSKTILLPYSANFYGGSAISVSRKVAVHPTNGQSYTQELKVNINAGAQFMHDATRDGDSTGLTLDYIFDFSEDFTVTGNTPTKVLNAFYFSAAIHSDTHS